MTAAGHIADVSLQKPLQNVSLCCNVSILGTWLYLVQYSIQNSANAANALNVRPITDRLGPGIALEKLRITESWHHGGFYPDK